MTPREYAAYRLGLLDIALAIDAPDGPLADLILGLFRAEQAYRRAELASPDGWDEACADARRILIDNAAA